MVVLDSDALACFAGMVIETGVWSRRRWKGSAIWKWETDVSCYYATLRQGDGSYGSRGVSRHTGVGRTYHNLELLSRG